MDRPDPLSRHAAAGAPTTGQVAPPAALNERIVVDRLADSFPPARSESEWLLTLLSADELRYIFEGPDHGETKD